MSSEPLPDGAPEWQLIRRVLDAAAGGDPARFNAELVDLHKAFPGSVKVKAYVGLALRYALIREYGRYPTRGELEVLSGKLSTQWNAVVPRLGEAALVELLEFIVGLRPDGEGTRGGMLVVKCAAALGLLVHDCTMDLDELEQASLELFAEVSGGA